MSITVEATYRNGVIKPKKRLKIPEGAKIRVTVTPLDEVEDPLADVIGICKGGPKDGAQNHDKTISEDPFADLIGVFHTGRKDGAANHDKYLKRKRRR